MLNVKAVDPVANGYLTVYPAGACPPLASNVNERAAQVFPKRVVVPVGEGGQVDVFSNAGGPEVVVDVAGYFTDGSDLQAPGSAAIAALSPTGPATRGRRFPTRRHAPARPFRLRW